MKTNSFIYKVKALYWANDGHFSLSSPMKMYHGYMIEKITDATSPKLKNLAWLITHVVTGVLAYPILGFFAGVDMAFKLLNWHLGGKVENPKSYNEFVILFQNIHKSPASGSISRFYINSNSNIVISPLFKMFKEYEVRFCP